MPRKKASSQWDFGELFTPEETRQIWSVGELTGKVKRALEAELGTVWVAGEITNLRRQNSGHIYFSIKDARAQLSCVLFRGQDVDNRDLLEAGKEIILRGDLTVYEARGQYQLLVREIEFKGVGALQAEFEKLKRKLDAEGLFAGERKRPLLRLNSAIGVVTSPTGAALRDIQHVIARRDPRLSVVLAPCRVQGKGAAEEIAEALDALNAYHMSRAQGEGLDLILMTRGGGSLEDLWAFNEESVARAVYRSGLPVISAIGHEIDFTISDFVADLRAATPSAAAELVTEGVFSSLGFIADAPRRMGDLVARRMARETEGFARLRRRLSLARPSRRVGELIQRLDDLQAEMSSVAGHRFEALKRRGAELAGRLGRLRPSRQLGRKRETLEFLDGRLREQASARLDTFRVRLERLQERLRLLSPGSVLERGYSITMDAETGEVIRSSKKVQAGRKIRTRLDDGEFGSVVED